MRRFLFFSYFPESQTFLLVTLVTAKNARHYNVLGTIRGPAH